MPQIFMPEIIFESALVLSLQVRDIPASNSSPGPAILTEEFRGFVQLLQVATGIVP
jgi:hypothetical protein